MSARDTAVSSESNTKDISRRLRGSQAHGLWPDSAIASSATFRTAFHTGSYFWLEAPLNLHTVLWSAPATPTALSFGRLSRAESSSTTLKRQLVVFTPDLATYQDVLSSFCLEKGPNLQGSGPLDELLRDITPGVRTCLQCLQICGVPGESYGAVPY